MAKHTDIGAFGEVWGWVARASRPSNSGVPPDFVRERPLVFDRICQGFSSSPYGCGRDARNARPEAGATQRGASCQGCYYLP
jgi:hypothetical protein